VNGLSFVTLETGETSDQPLDTGEEPVVTQPAQTLWQKLEGYLDCISQAERTFVVAAIRDLLLGSIKGETAFWARISGKNQDREFPYMDGIETLINALLTVNQEDREEILNNLGT
jgi:hypothetical protein